ncbi:unnamed protein product, partial [Phaeothamnion confervicola]
ATAVDAVTAAEAEWAAVVAEAALAQRVAQLREALVEEGARRRCLYEELSWRARMELQRLRAANGRDTDALRMWRLEAALRGHCDDAAAAANAARLREGQAAPKPPPNPAEGAVAALGTTGTGDAVAAGTPTLAAGPTERFEDTKQWGAEVRVAEAVLELWRMRVNDARDMLAAAVRREPQDWLV